MKRISWRSWPLTPGHHGNANNSMVEHKWGKEGVMTTSTSYSDRSKLQNCTDIVKRFSLQSLVVICCFDWWLARTQWSSYHKKHCLPHPPCHNRKPLVTQAATAFPRLQRRLQHPLQHRSVNMWSSWQHDVAGLERGAIASMGRSEFWCLNPQQAQRTPFATSTMSSAAPLK